MTRLPAFKFRKPPQLFFDAIFADKPISTAGQARTIAGDFAEEITATMTGARRLVTDSRCLVCPDLQWDDNVFFESKSVGRSNTAIIYECRARKDAHFVEHYGKQLYYWFWFHKAGVVASETVDGLRKEIAATLYLGVVVDFPTLHAALLPRPTKTLNTAYIRTGPNSGARLGYGSYDYGVGWSVPRGLLLDIAYQCRGLTLPRKVHGHNITDKPTGMAPLVLHVSDWSFLRFIET